MKWVVMIGCLGGIGFLAWYFLMRSKGDSDSSTDVGPERGRGGTDEDTNKHWLMAVSGKIKGKSYHVGARNVTIGRGTNCFVQTKDKESSRVHCQLRHTPKGLQITDMSSANGTRVNDKKIQIHILVDGDRIALGDTALVYHLEADFDQDAGVGAKAVGQTQFEATAYAEGGASMLNPKEIAEDALKSCGGDLPAAAKKLKMDEATFRKLISK